MIDVRGKPWAYCHGWNEGKKWSGKVTHAKSTCERYMEK